MEYGRLIFGISTVSSLPFMVIERFLATIFLSTYEKRYNKNFLLLTIIMTFLAGIICLIILIYYNFGR